MIAEEFNYNQEPTSSIPKGSTILYILKTIKKSPVYFKLALTNPRLVKPLNENKLTQILVEQINAILLESEVPILAQTQYSDVFLGTKGIPDFYFHMIEKGQTSEPLFIVEAKILPTPPPKEREKEYVIGNKQNGGIERFKIEKHGKGFSECGIIGFIEKENFDFWETTINGWIKNLAKKDTIWNEDEILRKIEYNAESVYLNSKVNTITLKNIILHHFWISNL